MFDNRDVHVFLLFFLCQFLGMILDESFNDLLAAHETEYDDDKPVANMSELSVEEASAVTAAERHKRLEYAERKRYCKRMLQRRFVKCHAVAETERERISGKTGCENADFRKGHYSDHRQQHCGIQVQRAHEHDRVADHMHEFYLVKHEEHAAYGICYAARDKESEACRRQHMIELSDKHDAGPSRGKIHHEVRHGKFAAPDCVHDDADDAHGTNDAEQNPSGCYAQRCEREHGICASQNQEDE